MNVNPLSPITVVKVYSNVPFDSSYKDTINFASTSAQQSFLASRLKKTYTGLGPVRMQNAIRLPENADFLYDCNYIAFQNANFSNKWFYAFIKEINFINVNMTEIVFEMDVLQTWWFNITIHPSFIEREHIANDAHGRNTVWENLEIGDYLLSDHVKAGVSDTSTIVIASTVDENGEDVEGGYYGGVYSGVQLIKCTSDEANSYISKLTKANKADAIVSVFMASDEFMAGKGQPPYTKELVIPKQLTDIDGYKPKNNKLFCYPYNFLYCINTNGNTAEFRYEMFYEATCKFGLIGESSCNPQVTLLPRNYKVRNLGNLNEKMVLNGFPQCAFNIDSFKAWLAQNGSSTAINVLASSATLAAGAIVSGGIGAVAAIGGVAGIAGTLAQVTANSAKPPQANGASGSGNTFAYGQLDFHFYNAHITAEYARVIDDYFTRFGYATNQVGIPNINSRPSFNYVKTIDCSITGSVPFEDLVKIRSIFDSGVTFWHGDFVGDYTRANK